MYLFIFLVNLLIFVCVFLNFVLVLVFKWNIYKMYMISYFEFFDVYLLCLIYVCSKSVYIYSKLLKIFFFWNYIEYFNIV